jgi:hypothetical protein
MGQGSQYTEEGGTGVGWPVAHAASAKVTTAVNGIGILVVGLLCE